MAIFLVSIFDEGCAPGESPAESGKQQLVATLETKLGKAERERPHLLEHLPPGPSLPDAEILVPHRRPRAEHRGIAEQQLGKCVRFPGKLGGTEKPEVPIYLPTGQCLVIRA